MIVAHVAEYVRNAVFAQIVRIFVLVEGLYLDIGDTYPPRAGAMKVLAIWCGVNGGSLTGPL